MGANSVLRYGITLQKRGAGNKRSKVSKSIKELLEEEAKDDLIVTPAYNEFLTSGWDEAIPNHVAERIANIIKKPQRDRRYSWSASSAGKCMRRQEFAFLGMPIVGQYDPRLQRIFLNGTWVHLRHQAIFLTAGILDSVEVTIRKKSQRARCTMDGMGVASRGRYEGAEFGFELKGRNQWTYQVQQIGGADEETRKQVDFEFLLSGLDVFVIFNENKTNQEIQEWVILRDEERVRDMAKQIKELNYAIDRHRLHPMLDECKRKLKSGEFYKCPYGGDGGVCASSGKWPNQIGSLN